MIVVSSGQAAVCARFGVNPSGIASNQKVGVAKNARTGRTPFNGLRHRPEGETSGWYIWAGEQWSDDPDFFEPLHSEHLAEWCPAVIPYLALPPGWRFLIASGYEDVWHDPSLLPEGTGLR